MFWCWSKLTHYSYKMMFYLVTWSREIALKIPHQGKMRINRKVLQLLQILSRLSLEKDLCWRIIVRVFAVMRSSLLSAWSISKLHLYTLPSESRSFTSVLPIVFQCIFPARISWEFPGYLKVHWLTFHAFYGTFPQTFLLYCARAHAPVRCRSVWGLRFSFHTRTQDWTDAPNDR